MSWKWDKRKKCKTKEQASEALVDAIIDNAELIVQGSIDDSHYLLGTMSEFASWWDIPFNQLEAYNQALELLGGKDEDTYSRGWYGSLC